MGSSTLPRRVAPPFDTSTTCSRSVHTWQVDSLPSVLLPGAAPRSPEPEQGTVLGTSVTTYEVLPAALWKTRALAPGMSISRIAGSRRFSSGSLIGRTRSVDLLLSLPHQSLDSSAMLVPWGVASTTLRARVSSFTVAGCARSV